MLPPRNSEHPPKHSSRRPCAEWNIAHLRALAASARSPLPVASQCDSRQIGAEMRAHGCRLTKMLYEREIPATGVNVPPSALSGVCQVRMPCALPGICTADCFGRTLRRAKGASRCAHQWTHALKMRFAAFTLSCHFHSWCRIFPTGSPSVAVPLALFAHS